MAHGQGGAEIGFDRAPTLTCNHEAPISAYSVAKTLCAAGHSQNPLEETLVPMQCITGDITHTLKAEGFDVSEDGTGRGTPLVPVCFDTTQITSPANRSNPQPGDPCHPLAAQAHVPAIAFQERGRAGGPNLEIGGDLAFALTAPNGGGRAQERNVLAPSMQVRRLTPGECERLQGFPDNYTMIPWRKKPAEDCPDGPRYKALGNIWAVPNVAWIGRRIAAHLRQLAIANDNTIQMKAISA